MNLENTNKSKSSKELSLRDLILNGVFWFKYLWSKWVLILLMGLLGGALGFYYAYSKKPVYTATTAFVLEDDKAGGAGGLGSIVGIASIAGIDLGSGGGGIFQGDNIIELYKSRNMIQKALLTTVEDNGSKSLLIDRYITFNELRQAWAGNPNLKDIQFKIKQSDSLVFTRLQDSIIGVIANDINKNYLTVFKPDKKLSIIKAEVKAQDEFFAKNFNEQIVKTVSNFYIQTKTKKSAANVAILQEKTDSVRRIMNGAIYNAAAIADATPNLNPTRQITRTAPLQRSQFNAETNKAILGTLVQNLEMAKLALLKDAPLIQVVDEPIYPLPKAGFGKLRGLITGGILFGFLTVLFLLTRKFFVSFFNER